MLGTKNVRDRAKSAWNLQGSSRGYFSVKTCRLDPGAMWRDKDRGSKERVFEVHKNVYLLERELHSLEEHFKQNPQNDNFKAHCKKLQEIVAGKGDHSTVYVLCGRFYIYSVTGINLMLFGIRAKKDCVAVVRTSWNCGRVMWVEKLLDKCIIHCGKSTTPSSIQKEPS